MHVVQIKLLCEIACETIAKEWLLREWVHLQREKKEKKATTNSE